jgi:ElaB/YqjD/DUF883 family membrane-anchored ribosome-binding protein
MASTPDSVHTIPSQARSNVGTRSIGEQTSKVAEDVRELGHIALTGAGEAIQSVKDKGSAALDMGREKASAAREGFEGYVAENPFKSVLMAAGVGALLGYALRSKL